MPGAIIPMQDSTWTTPNEDPTKPDVTHTVMTTTDLMENVPIDLMINLDNNLEAKGEIFVDDGYSQNMLDNNMYDFYTFTYSAGSLKKEWGNLSTSNGLPDSVVSKNRMLKKITFTNMQKNNFDFACYNIQSGK